MNLSVYQTKATGTFKPGGKLDAEGARLCDWALGVAGEAGELVGLIKHHVFHRQRLNKMEVAKEVGDVLWYLSALCQSLDINIADCAELNIAKLQHRHEGSFSFRGSANRKEAEVRFEETGVYEEFERRILRIDTCE